MGPGTGVITFYMYTFLFSSRIIDGFLSNIPVIKLLSQNSEVLHQNGTPLWHNSETVGHEDVRLGQIVYICVL